MFVNYLGGRFVRDSVNVGSPETPHRLCNDDCFPNGLYDRFKDHVKPIVRKLVTTTHIDPSLSISSFIISHNSAVANLQTSYAIDPFRLRAGS
jgi:hypothetical protein